MSQRSTAQHCHIDTPFCTIRKSHVTWNFAVPGPHSEEIRRCILLFLCTLDYTYRRLRGCVVMGINRTRRLFGGQKKDAWAASQCTLYGFRPRCNHFLSPLFFCFFSLWSRKLHFRYAHRYYLDIYDKLKQSKELSRRGFWLDNRCLKMTIGFTLLLHFFTFAEEVWRTSSSAKGPELTWIFVSAIPERKLKRW